MCDYSLHLMASRPARVGDELISTSLVFSWGLRHKVAKVDKYNKGRSNIHHDALEPPDRNRPTDAIVQRPSARLSYGTSGHWRHGG